MSEKPQALLVSGYNSMSQKGWAEYVQRTCTDYQWRSILLPPRYFAWRMRGAPLSAYAFDADAINDKYQLIVATSSVDLATLQSIYPSLRNVHSILYFHENQFAYPAANQPQTVVDWQMVSLYSALRADKVLFNSQYNRLSFINGLTALLKKLPDLVPSHLIATINQKSAILPVPIGAKETILPNKNQAVKILWNHRWEWDKSPELLLAIIKEIDHKKLPVEVVITGQQFRQKPTEFDQIEKKYRHIVSSMGFIDERKSYLEQVSQCQIVLSTAIHEFQGIAILEAVHHGCIPLLPNRLSYPEIFTKPYLYRADGSNEQQAKAVIKKLQHWLHYGLPETPDVSDFEESELREQYRGVICLADKAL